MISDCKTNKYNKSTTCCFSGYRPEKFDFPLDASCPDYALLLGFINLSILLSVEKGYTTFICGMAQGFDLVCGETVLRLKKHPNYGHIHLVAAIPFRGHSERWPDKWRLRHQKVEALSDQAVYVRDHYAPDCFHERNRFMADRSGRLICYYDGKRGGTAYTVDYCGKQGVEIVNLAQKIKAARA